MKMALSPKGFVGRTVLQKDAHCRVRHAPAPEIGLGTLITFGGHRLVQDRMRILLLPNVGVDGALLIVQHQRRKGVVQPHLHLDQKPAPAQRISPRMLCVVETQLQGSDAQRLKHITWAGIANRSHCNRMAALQPSLLPRHGHCRACITLQQHKHRP